MLIPLVIKKGKEGKREEERILWLMNIPKSGHILGTY
jgi:hypothetical protein